MKFTEDAPQGSSGPGKFIKLKDGESIYVILRGDIKTSYQKWNGSTYEPAKKGEEGASLRFKVNAVVFEDKKPVVKILEGGGHLYFDLKTINDEYALEITMIKISRAGERQGTRYTVMPAGPKAQPDANMLTAIESLTLHSFEPKGAEPVKPSVGADLPNFFEDEDRLPF
jgi:hypothetical protein